MNTFIKLRTLTYLGLNWLYQNGQVIFGLVLVHKPITCHVLGVYQFYNVYNFITKQSNFCVKMKIEKLRFWIKKQVVSMCRHINRYLVVLKNCEPELSYILAEFFNMCLKESCFFQIVGRSHLWSLYLRMLGKGLLLKSSTLLVFFLWLVKPFKNL